MNDKKRLTTLMVEINSRWYMVQELPKDVDDPEKYTKGVAYHYKTEMSDLLLPFLGVMDDTDMEDFDFNTRDVGIYFQHHGRKTKRFIIRPRTAEELEIHSASRARDLAAAVIGYEFHEDDFMDNELRAADIGKDLYQPPIYANDDPINMLVKLGIRLKEAPFEPYGKRLEALAIKSTSNERNNNKNNLRRRHRESRTMSAHMMENDSEIWELEPAILLRDLPGAMHKMDIPEGSILAIYPRGIPFDIDPSKIIDVTDMIAEAIDSTSRSESGRKKTGKKKTAINDEEEEDDDDAEPDAESE